MSLTLLGVLALIGYYLFPAKKPTTAAVAVPQVVPLDPTVVAPVRTPPRYHGFDTLLELRDCLRNQGHSETEVDAALAHIPALLLTHKDTRT